MWERPNFPSPSTSQNARQREASRPCLDMRSLYTASPSAYSTYSTLALRLPRALSCRRLIDGAARQAVTSLTRSTATSRAGRVYVLLVRGRAGPCMGAPPRPPIEPRPCTFFILRGRSSRFERFT